MYKLIYNYNKIVINIQMYNKGSERKQHTMRRNRGFKKKQNHNRQKSDLRFRLTWSLLLIMC